MIEDRRFVPRLALQVSLVLVLPDSDLKFDGRTRDLSSSGVFFYSDAPLAEDQEVELLMTFASELTRNSIQVACMARVLRVERDQVPANTGIAAAIQKFDFLTEGTLDISDFSFRLGGI